MILRASVESLDDWQCCSLTGAVPWCRGRSTRTNIELQYLVWVTALTGVLRTPYVLDRYFIRGIRDTVGYPENPRPQTLWARCPKGAHDNAIENLVIFAALVLVAHIFAIPRARTIAFTVGFLSQAAIAWQLFVS